MRNYRNGDANNNPVTILILGAVFTTISILGYFGKMEVEGDPKVMKIVLVIFGLIGVYFIVFGIYRAIVLLLLKKLQDDDSAYITNAKFVTSKTTSATSTRQGFGIGNQDLTTAFKANIYKKIVYTYSDENGVERKGTSLLSYYPNQVKYLEEKHEFKIKCKGKLSLVIEDVPTEQNLININLFHLKDSEINIK